MRVLCLMDLFELRTRRLWIMIAIMNEFFLFISFFLEFLVYTVTVDCEMKKKDLAHRLLCLWYRQYEIVADTSDYLKKKTQKGQLQNIIIPPIYSIYHQFIHFNANLFVLLRINSFCRQFIFLHLAVNKIASKRIFFFVISH